MSGKACLSCERGNTIRCKICGWLHSSGSDHCHEYCSLAPYCYDIMRKQPSPNTNQNRVHTPIINPTYLLTNQNRVHTPIINPTYSLTNLLSHPRSPILKITYLSSRYTYSTDIVSYSSLNNNIYLKISNDSCYYRNIESFIGMNRGPCIVINNMSYKIYAGQHEAGSPFYIIRS